jgi:hypothetical protein
MRIASVVMFAATLSAPARAVIPDWSMVVKLAQGLCAARHKVNIAKS